MSENITEKTENNIENDVTVETEAKQSFFANIFRKIKESRQRKLDEIQKKELSEEESKKVEEKIEVANKEIEQSQSSSKKKTIRNVVFFVFNIALVVGILIWNVLSSDDFTAFELLKIDYSYIVVVFLLLIAIVILDTMMTHRMIFRKTYRSRWPLAYKSTATLRYYDAITPMAAGGQAFMISYLISRDVAGSTACSIPVSKLLFQNTSWLIVTGISLIVSASRGMSSFASVASILGFVITLLCILLILFFSVSKKTGTKLVDWGIKFLVKIRILKNYEKYYAKVMAFVEDYQSIMKEYTKAKFDVFYQFLLNGARFVALFSIPYFICLAFGSSSLDYVSCFVYTAVIDLAASFIPLPGGTGMNELTFTILFSQALGGSTFWALLVWRFCSFYFYLLQGLGVLAYDTLYGNRKYRWIKKKFELQQESREFRRIQIENFRQERDKRRKKEKRI